MTVSFANRLAGALGRVAGVEGERVHLADAMLAYSEDPDDVLGMIEVSEEIVRGMSPEVSKAEFLALGVLAGIELERGAKA